MRHASLFTGIGGFDLAAQWMGWENVFQVESGRMCFTSNLLADLSSALKANELKVQQDIEVTLTFKYKV